ncbi:hypothetical protein BSL78_29411 [Apostichopus japonicus]|uniref:Retrotransposon gag domain-containing protein n=1 Tax=Stichopus japonicus TaxID=307972 RepID=A0A2G8JDF6_STIJA|nr:hypothetical protein BSL78_29411 [Apostichopus japonicus]
MAMFTTVQTQLESKGNGFEHVERPVRFQGMAEYPDHPRTRQEQEEPHTDDMRAKSLTAITLGQEDLHGNQKQRAMATSHMVTTRDQECPLDIMRREMTMSTTGSVEEYYEEFERLRNRLELNDDEEALMAQFLDGLQERINRKLERQIYSDFRDLSTFLVQAEQHIKPKSQDIRNRPKTPWAPSNGTKPVDKAKA